MKLIITALIIVASLSARAFAFCDARESTAAFQQCLDREYQDQQRQQEEARRQREEQQRQAEEQRREQQRQFEEQQRRQNKQ